MRKILMLLIAILCNAAGLHAQAIDPVTLLIEKVVRAIDRKVQTMQNQVLRLQNLQKQLENRLSLDRLTDIGDVLYEEKKLWEDYYASLKQTSQQIMQNPKYLGVLTLRTDLLKVIDRSKHMVLGDHRLGAKERVYFVSRLDTVGGQLRSVTDRLVQVLRAENISATDAQRLALLEETAKEVQEKANVIRTLVSAARSMSLLRAKDDQDAVAIRKLYGLNQ